MAALAKLRSRDGAQRAQRGGGWRKSECHAARDLRLARRRLFDDNCRLDRVLSVLRLLPLNSASMFSLLHPFGYSLPSAPRGRPSTSSSRRVTRITPVQLAADAAVSPLPSAPAPTSTFNNTWYAVGLSEQIAGDRLLGTRLWGEPMVVYRDAAGEATCVRDLCPHRSAPLSMGELEDGVLRCPYRVGLRRQGRVRRRADGEGQEGRRVRAARVRAGLLRRGARRAAVGVARRNLAADAAKLPSPPAEPTVADTVLDYEADWAAVVEELLDAPAPPSRRPTSSAARARSRRGCSGCRRATCGRSHRGARAC